MESVHPFPARMAPDLAWEKIADLPPGSTVLDPMCGSGTTLHYALKAGHKAVGWDIDPLAVKMARTWCKRFNIDRLRKQTEYLSATLQHQNFSSSRFSHCLETQEFADYWFAEEQKNDLNRLSVAIENLFRPGRTRDFFQIALSRIIITKFKGASLAWDISHSRPHKKKANNSFQTIQEFFKSVEKLLQIMSRYSYLHDAYVQLGDCKKIVTRAKFDAIITSPPYLNAIDYMRGHKFSLIWMGYTIPQLRAIRSKSIGSERSFTDFSNNLKFRNIVREICKGQALNSKVEKFLFRYISDCETLLNKMQDMLKMGGSLIVVVGNSTQYGTKIFNEKIFRIFAAESGLRLTDRKTRSISAGSRYLPISNKENRITNRIKTETVLQFVRA